MVDVARCFLFPAIKGEDGAKANDESETFRIPENKMPKLALLIAFALATMASAKPAMFMGNDGADQGDLNFRFRFGELFMMTMQQPVEAFCSFG